MHFKLMLDIDGGLLIHCISDTHAFDLLSHDCYLLACKRICTGEYVRSFSLSSLSVQCPLTFKEGRIEELKDE